MPDIELGSTLSHSTCQETSQGSSKRKEKQKCHILVNTPLLKTKAISSVVC